MFKLLEQPHACIHVQMPKLSALALTIPCDLKKEKNTQNVRLAWFYFFILYFTEQQLLTGIHSTNFLNCSTKWRVKPKALRVAVGRFLYAHVQTTSLIFFPQEIITISPKLQHFPEVQAVHYPSDVNASSFASTGTYKPLERMSG